MGTSAGVFGDGGPASTPAQTSFSPRLSQFMPSQFHWQADETSRTLSATPQTGVVLSHSPPEAFNNVPLEHSEWMPSVDGEIQRGEMRWHSVESAGNAGEQSSTNIRM